MYAGIDIKLGFIDQKQFLVGEIYMYLDAEVFGCSRIDVKVKYAMVLLKRVVESSPVVDLR